MIQYCVLIKIIYKFSPNVLSETVLNRTRKDQLFPCLQDIKYSTETENVRDEYIHSMLSNSFFLFMKNAYVFNQTDCHHLEFTDSLMGIISSWY